MIGIPLQQLHSVPVCTVQAAKHTGAQSRLTLNSQDSGASCHSGMYTCVNIATNIPCISRQAISRSIVTVISDVHVEHYYQYKLGAKLFYDECFEVFIFRCPCRALYSVH